MMQTYMLEVIEAQPEEGGGGAVHATLLSNYVTVLLKVCACSGRQCKVHNSIAVYAAMVSLFYSFWVTEAL